METKITSVGQKMQKQKYLLNGFWTHYIRSFIIIFSGHFTNEMARNDVDTFSINQNYFRLPFVFFHFFYVNLYSHSLIFVYFNQGSEKQKQNCLFFFTAKMEPSTYVCTPYEFPNKTDICVEFEMFK